MIAGQGAPAQRSQTTRMKLQHIGLPSLGRMGCLLGIAAAFLPSVLCGIVSVGLAGLAQRWLESWQDLTFSALGVEVTSVDLVQLLRLEGVLDGLHLVTGASGLVLVLVIIGLALAAGALLALITMLVGLAYNVLAAVTGGVVVEMEGWQDGRMEG